MSIYTEEEARFDVLCPFARTFAVKTAEPTCRAGGCPLWRWLPRTCDEGWKQLLKQVAAEIGDKSPAKAKAAAEIATYPEKYGQLPDRGYCGAGGKPEVLGR